MDGSTYDTDREILKAKSTVREKKDVLGTEISKASA
jgi:hypothetical protein